MKAREFEQKAKAIVGSAKHFTLYTEIGDYHGINLCEVQLWMTDPWGQDYLVFTTTQNGDQVTDMLLLNDLKERLKLFKEHMRTHYDYENRITIETA